MVGSVLVPSPLASITSTRRVPRGAFSGGSVVRRTVGLRVVLRRVGFRVVRRVVGVGGKVVGGWVVGGWVVGGWVVGGWVVGGWVVGGTVVVGGKVVGGKVVGGKVVGGHLGGGSGGSTMTTSVRVSSELQCSFIISTQFATLSSLWSPSSLESPSNQAWASVKWNLPSWVTARQPIRYHLAVHRVSTVQYSTTLQCTGSVQTQYSSQNQNYKMLKLTFSYILLCNEPTPLDPLSLYNHYRVWS